MWPILYIHVGHTGRGLRQATRKIGKLKRNDIGKGLLPVYEA